MRFNELQPNRAITGLLLRIVSGGIWLGLAVLPLRFLLVGEARAESPTVASDDDPECLALKEAVEQSTSLTASLRKKIEIANNFGQSYIRLEGGVDPAGVKLPVGEARAHLGEAEWFVRIYSLYPRCRMRSGRLR